MNKLPLSLSAWANYPQFVLVNRNKVPVNTSFRPINSHDPAHWMDHKEAYACAELLGLGVGFVFTPYDPFFFIDVDHCIVDGKWNAIAEQMLTVFTGCASEISTSGDGLHILGTGTAPEHGKKNADYRIEFYTEGRMVLLTGIEAHGNVQTVSQHLQWLIDNYFPPSAATVPEEWRNTPIPGWEGPEDDDVLFEKLMRQKKFGTDVSVTDLMAGKEDILAINYPPFKDRDPYDRSRADFALAEQLAFWTGKDHDRIRRIMFRSALFRGKWTKKDYLVRTISNAVEVCQEVHDQNYYQKKN